MFLMCVLSHDGVLSFAMVNVMAKKEKEREKEMKEWCEKGQREYNQQTLKYHQKPPIDLSHVYFSSYLPSLFLFFFLQHTLKSFFHLVQAEVRGTFIP